MNNLLSLEWLREFVDIKVAPEELARRLSLVGAGVEHVLSQDAGLDDNILVGKIMALDPHPNADSLTVCRVQIANQIRTIVCGGSNLYSGQLVAVAVPGARVRWHGEGELVEIKETELRGVKSFGMICAASEIGLGDALPAVGGKEILDVGKLVPGSMRTGTKLKEALGFADLIFDVEATSNRPDLMSVLGVAREAVAAKGGVFKKIVAAKIPKTKARVPLTVLDKKLCPRYLAVRVDGVKVGESPWWLKRRLLAAGVRPINNLVDITNYVRLELGHPMHAFDAARVDKKIIVRRAHAGEKFVALDDSAHSLTSDMLVIADAKHALCVAGVMGGKNSGVSAATTSVIFEAAAFDPVSVRKTARALSLYSDSQLLFEKGLSQKAPEAAMARAVELCLALAGGTVVAVSDAQVNSYRAPVFSFDFSAVEKFVGVKISVPEMKRILTSLGFGVKGSGVRVKITVPYWRDHDIEASVDFMEEIARVYSYDNVPTRLPAGAPPDREPSQLLLAERELREFFSGFGFNEVYTNSFMRLDEIQKAGDNSDSALGLLNPLSSEITHLRPSLLPSILKVVAENEINFPTGNIFEVSNVYLPRAGETPREELYLAVCVWGGAAEKNPGELFFALKGAVEQLFGAWGISTAALGTAKTENKSWHPARILEIVNPHTAGHLQRGVLAEVHPQVTAAFGINSRVAVCLVPVEALVAVRTKTKSYSAPLTYPPAKRDIAFTVDERVAYSRIAEILNTVDARLTQFELFDTFRGAVVGENKKSLAFHLTYSAPDRTLTSDEVEKLHTNLVDQLERELAAEIRE